MNRFIIPITTILLAAFIYAGSLIYDHVISTTSKPKEFIATITSAPEKNIHALVPDFKFTPLEGKEFHIKDLRGSVVILNFWASWCAPCVAEFPDLLDIIDQYNGKIILVALSSDQTQASVEKFIAAQSKKHGAEINKKSVFIGLDPGRRITRDLFNVTTYPESFILDSNGQIIKHIIGIDDWHKGSTQEILKSLTKDKSKL